MFVKKIIGEEFIMLKDVIDKQLYLSTYAYS